MTKQEEIREGIAEVVKSVTGCNDWKAREVAVKVTEKEASQGCVIKVEGELPPLRTIPRNAKETKEIKLTIPAWWDDVALESYLGRIHQQDMLKAGYHKTEPLVEA